MCGAARGSLAQLFSHSSQPVRISPQENTLLSKAANKIPGGVPNRWIKIAEFINHLASPCHDRNENEIIDKMKERRREVALKQMKPSTNAAPAPASATAPTSAPGPTRAPATASSASSKPAPVASAATKPSNPPSPSHAKQPTASPVAVPAAAASAPGPPPAGGGTGGSGTEVDEWSPEQQKV